MDSIRVTQLPLNKYDKSKKQRFRNREYGFRLEYQQESNVQNATITCAEKIKQNVRLEILRETIKELVQRTQPQEPPWLGECSLLD